MGGVAPVRRTGGIGEQTATDTGDALGGGIGCQPGKARGTGITGGEYRGQCMDGVSVACGARMLRA